MKHISQYLEQELSKLHVDQAYVSHQPLYRKHDGVTYVVPTQTLSQSNQFERPIDLLEIYCEPNSQLSHQVTRLGGIAVRFTKTHGDLTTKEGQNQLWTWIHMYEPRHVWVAPECRLWGNFARFNMGRSLHTYDRIHNQREADRPHLILCNQLYFHQISESRHFHLEQPQGSEMIDQPELTEVRLGTLPATFDMCHVGKLKLPNAEKFLKKRTQVFTTSRKMFIRLHAQFCLKQHQHDPIKGKFQDHGTWKPISAYAQAYTAQFARTVGRVLLDECRVPEKPLIEEELILGLEDHERPEMAQELLQQQKRRRLHMKLPETSLYGRSPSWKDIFRIAGYETARVGKTSFLPGTQVVHLIQQLVPEFTVKLVLACRGTDRHQMQTLTEERFAWRKTMVVDRNTGEIRSTGPAENWLVLPRLKQIRSTGPAKISLTIFGDREEESHVPAAIPPSSVASEALESVPNKSVVPADSSVPEVSSTNPNVNLEEGWAPKIIPKSGPDFLKLGATEKADLRRLHNNLGHPDVSKLVRLLTEQGAKPEIVAAARDMVCDTCVETQTRPRLSQPGRIHPARDFNDVVGADGAYWTNRHGKVFHFMHFIDEATLYHVGSRCSRKTEDQIQSFVTNWLQWAGPCQTLYLDPAGEYVSDAWATYLQSEGVKVHMTAAEAHWQNGRAEIHGRIIKNMLTRMEKDREIASEQEFAQCLRQAFAAKNSLSRIHGFTPEQCLLGKSPRLPASLVADEETTSHILADSETPEGIRFKESLLRREQARKAFVQADNDSAFRRALLRQSRPGKVEFDKGDWVLYWRKATAANRREPGRWHGPAQVIAVEHPKVVWLSHLGRIIRASPEQIRPASLREYSQLPKGSDGNVLDEQPKGKGYVDLGSNQPDTEVELLPHAPDHASNYSPSAAAESQPEREEFPTDPSSDSLPELEEPPNSQDVEMDGQTIPVPDDDDDELTVEQVYFGDDVSWDSNSLGVWEIELVEQEFDVQVAQTVCDTPGIFEEIFVATSDRKQRVEVNYRSLSSGEQQLFDAAKNKEVKAWLDHGTVKKLAKGTLQPEQIMRCRWLLTWKDPLPGGTENRAKARLVILGFEDPGVGVVPNDAPTLGKDARQLLLQKVASNHWDLINFDISTAFLKGQGDGRPLGIHAPVEIRKALKMKPDEQCSLEGGAYGRVDAPYLWYRALSSTLVSLGFVPCPFDGCLFMLVTPNADQTPRVRGVLGIHVDDGIGGGDSYFGEVIEKLRGIYEFGAYNEKEFDFCGVHYRQWDDGSIEMDQVGYLQKIEPIEIPRSRRKEPDALVSEVERQHLRRLCGSIQFAAVHTRPDLAAKTGQLQSVVTRAQVKHLMEANRVLYEGKKHAVCLLIVPISEKSLAFCSFSDASFSTAQDLSSRQGTLIFSTDAKLAQNQRTVVCPIAWSSRKIPRVVTSTLSAEAMSLSSALDRLSYIRICWEWLKNPAVDWADPLKVLERAPKASAVTDCKSVYDVATKTSTPVCSEYRTTLECLLIRERLQENVVLRWISTQAMLADSLTKSMDSAMLRECLRTGQYALFDEHESLKQRASKREKLQWLKNDRAAVEHDM